MRVDLHGSIAVAYRAPMAIYHWLRVRSAGRSWTDAYTRFRESDPQGAKIWGAFSGLFGIGSNELVLVLHTEGAAPIRAVTKAGFEVVESHVLVPTVRPDKFEPLTRPGLYVFRFFDVAHEDVDEIAQLSSEAWTSFENTDACAAQPQGLFCQADRSGPRGVMVLLTWYDSLDSWQSSRKPAPEATDNFSRRGALTRGTIAYATRLVGT